MTRHRQDGLRKICGCSQRAWAKCRHPWHFSFLYQGTHHRFSLNRHLGRNDLTYGDAREQADRLRTAIRSGTFRGKKAVEDEVATPVLTFAAFAERWRIREGIKLVAAKDHGYRLKRIEAFILPGTQPTRTVGQTPLVQVRTDDIEAYRDARRARGLSPVTINHDLKLLRRMFNWGIRKGYIDRTPFKVGTEPVIRLEREIPRRKRFQNEDDEQRVLSVANHQLRGVIVTMLDTGCRPGEVMDMRWANVSFERREWVIVAQVEKTRNERIIPLSKRVMAVLELRRLDPSGEPFPPDAYVFGDSLGRKVKSVRAAFRNACEALKIDGLQLRDLRHEAASRFDEAGMPINYVSKFLGHTNLTTTTRYLNVQRREMHRVMDRYEETFASRLQERRNEDDRPAAADKPTDKKNSPIP